MKSDTIKIAITTVLLLLGKQYAYSQGTMQFVNLDFEHPNLPLIGFEVQTSNAIPGWTAYEGGNPRDTVAYNTFSLGGATPSLQGPGSSLTPLDGSYSLYLQGSSAGAPSSAAIAETGQIPLIDTTLSFIEAPGSSIQVTINGQIIPLVQIGSGPGYITVAGDVSAYAGQTCQLQFTTPPFGDAYIDDIRFSIQAVPEPGTLGLFGVGALLIGWRCFTQRR